ncbi:lysoplasmalogenase [Rhodanobacter sp. C03]|uniref:lysoplasmalogenase n=1 Tax=Rhodanobacter sp. C03 TaxID=1945858 RepID=UPI000987764E|nr:lysoplasmalogenase [Rhodanobacter sp. C03]OOG59385.1 lysoplasmalogenase [Rhodanobacter sp. C03]
MSVITLPAVSRPVSRWLALATLVVALGAIVGALMASGAASAVWLWLHWLCKPLATVLILLLAWRTQPPLSVRYQRWILVGIVCSLLGDVLLMLPQDLFVPGLVAFLCGHQCFIAAFIGDSRFGARPWWLLASLAYGAINLYLLWDSIAAPLRLPVIVYVVVLSSMGGQALARAWTFVRRGDAQAGSARRAAVGAMLFMLSDSVLAWNRFHAAIPLSSLWVLSTYYLALWWIARSVQRDDILVGAGAAQ